MLSAPGIASWQYALLQLQVGPALAPPWCPALSWEAGSPHGALAVPPSAAQGSQLEDVCSPSFPALDSCPFLLREWLRGRGRPPVPPSPQASGSLRGLSVVHASPGQWRPAHPAPALSSPLGPGNRLWRSSGPGPDEQGLAQLPGRLFQGITGTATRKKLGAKRGCQLGPSDWVPRSSLTVGPSPRHGRALSCSPCGGAFRLGRVRRGVVPAGSQQTWDSGTAPGVLYQRHRETCWWGGPTLAAWRPP